MAKKDGRRIRGTSKHSGVVLYERTLPSGAIAWRARFVDPDTGRKKHETLPSVLTTEEQRATWAVKKAESLRGRTVALALGAPTKKNQKLADAVDGYFEDVGARLREKTLADYRSSADVFVAWATSKGIVLGDDVRPGHLADLREHLANKPRRAPAKKRRAGVRAPASINRELRGLKVLLEHLRRHELVPMITHDAIRDSLKLLPTPRPTPEFLRPTEIVKLVEAARRHDEDCFDLTREEKARGLTKGETPRFPAVLPYLVTVLLTGMRADEARLLKWSAVDLAAAPAGVIALRPEDVKTKHGRLVDLVVSPVLVALLAQLKLAAGEAVYVFGGKEPPTHDALEAARRRLVGATKKTKKASRVSFNSGPFSWQLLRSTCGTYLANSSIFGQGNSAYRESRQLGHSVTVAERHYLGTIHVAPEAKTLEAAMGVEAKLRESLGLAGSATKTAANAS